METNFVRLRFFFFFPVLLWIAFHTVLQSLSFSNLQKDFPNLSTDLKLPICFLSDRPSHVHSAFEPDLGFSSHSGWIQGGCDESTQPVWCFGFYISTSSPVAGSSHKIVFAEGTVENFLTTVPRDPKEFDWLLFKSPNFVQFKLFLEEINIQVF